MKNQLNYEYKIEFIDEYGDIVDYDHFDKLSDCMLAFYRCDKGCKVEMCLVRDEGNQYDGLQDRQHAYFFEDGKFSIPREFDGGCPIPKTHLNQITIQANEDK